MIGVRSAFTWLGNKAIDTVYGEVNQRLNRAGAAWQAMASALAPARTGALRSSLYYRAADRTLTVGVGVPYGIFVEFGTRHSYPHPYIRPALNALGRMLGMTLEMEFTAPAIVQPILAYPRKNVLFQTPSTLSRRQLEHVRRHLVPTSARLHRGNVRRAKMTVRRFG